MEWHWSCAVNTVSMMQQRQRTEDQTHYSQGNCCLCSRRDGRDGCWRAVVLRPVLPLPHCRRRQRVSLLTIRAKADTCLCFLLEPASDEWKSTWRHLCGHRNPRIKPHVFECLLFVMKSQFHVWQFHSKWHEKRPPGVCFCFLRHFIWIDGHYCASRNHASLSVVWIGKNEFCPS